LAQARDIMGRWIGIDYGVKRIGVAAADHRGAIATPATSLPGSGNASDDAVSILRWAADQDVAGIVVGLPLNMDGTDSRQTRLSRALADELRRRTTLPVELWDERLSTFQADEYLSTAELRPSRRQALRDALAAQVILQSFLDARRHNGGSHSTTEGPHESP